jgi:uncharacterized protein YcbX
MYVYPVKSCRGIARDEITLDEAGPQYDRNWMLIGDDGVAVTQRELPRLALVTPRLGEEALELTAPGMPALRIPFESGRRELRARLWADECHAFDEGETAADWFKEFGGARLRMVRFDPRHARRSSPEWTGPVVALNRFTDGYPILLLSEASLLDLSRRVGNGVPVDRFRPNIVISGIEAYEEDHLERLESASVSLRLVKPCSRCQVVDTDQATGEARGDLLMTLSAYRANPRLGGAVSLGQNAVILKGVGKRLRVGETLRAFWNF